MKQILKLIKAASELDSDDRAISKRNLFGMINEWRVHNLLYKLHISRERTSDVDLDVNQPWQLKVLYTLFSPLYLNFM
jgi:hypothetical protein